MIQSLNGLVLRFFRANRLLVLSSIISVMLAISLIITMAVFATNAKQSLVEELQKVYGDMDLSVGYNLDQGKVIDQAMLDKLTDHSDIKQSSGVLVTRLVVDQLGSDVYTVGVESDALAKSKYHFNENVANDEVIMNKDLAEALDVDVGDRINLASKPFIVKEVVPDFQAMGPTVDTLIFSRETVRQYLLEQQGITNEATYLLIKVKDDADVYQLANHMRQLDPELRIDVAEENEFMQQNLSLLNRYVAVFSVLVLIVTSLLVVSNFEVFIYKYRHQLAIMRSIGGTKEQIAKVVWLKSSLMNGFGAVLGFVLAWLGHRFLQPGLEKLFSFSISRMDFDYWVAMIVVFLSMLLIQLFMIIPAYRSGKVLPLKIIQENEQSDFANMNFRKRVGKVLGVLGLAFLAFGLILAVPSMMPLMVVLAALLLVLSLFVLFPIYLAPGLIRLLPLLRKILGKTAYVAVKNVIPQVRKNTFIILLISTLMIIASFGTALFQTLEKNEEQYLRDQYPTNILLKSRLGINTNINSSDLRTALGDIAGVKEVSTLSSANQAAVKRDERYIPFDYSLADLQEMVQQGLLPSFPKASHDVMIVTKEFADEHQLKVGDPVELGLYLEEGGDMKPTGRLIVGAIVDKLPGTPLEVLIDWQNTTYRTNYTVFERAFISSDHTEQTLRGLEELKRQYPELLINTYKQSLAQSKEMFYQRWSIFIVVMIVILLSVMFGVFNTLVNNIHSKRKEFAILRVISLDKKGIRQVILTQVLLYLLIGVILGIGAGVMVTYVLNFVDPGPVHFNLPFIGGLVAAMFTIALVVFIPFANKVANRNICLEFTQDNK